MNYKVLLSVLMVAAVACGKKMDEPVPNVKADFNGTVTVEYQGQDFDNENIKVNYTPSADGKTADITIFQIKFVPQMPVTIDVTIPAVPVTVSSTGISFSGTDIIPTAMGGPVERYKVTNLTGNLVDGTINFSLNFGSYPTRYSGTASVQ